MQPLIKLLLLCCVLSVTANIAIAGDDEQYERGARVFFERCSICHGNYGLGEGLIPLLIPNYANTNLLTEDTKASGREGTLSIIKHGTELANINEYMPPWSDELSLEELNVVTDFLILLKSDNQEARKLINKVSFTKDASARSGRHIFISRCSLCHGPGGKGDGKLAKFIKSPPPYNLTLSVLPDDLLKNIIQNGGQSVGRSPSMPAWRDELNDNEVRSVILFIKSIRKYK